MHHCRATRAIADTLVEAANDAKHGRLRVAITGITACGKSAFTEELLTVLQARDQRVTHIPIDGFHHPRSIRHRRGRDSAEGYYRDAYDYDVLISRVLKPLGPDGDGRYRPATFSLEHDAPVDPPFTQAAHGEIFLLDASFLLRPELVRYFDYKVFVLADFDVAEARGVARDALVLGGEADTRRLYQDRYHAAQRLYFREADPLRHADIILLNNARAHRVAFGRIHGRSVS